MIGTDLAQAKSFRAKRESSWDRSGGNSDYLSLAAGETRTIADLRGSGVISHIWSTIHCADPHYLRKLLLRAYWDGATEPAIESPIGDFFNLGHGMRATHACAPFSSSTWTTQLGGGVALNCWLPMPFREGARFEVVNESESEVGSFYYYIDYQEHDRLPEDLLYLHAQWRRENPCDGWVGPEGVWRSAAWHRAMHSERGKNLDGKGNYVVLDTEGRGHFVGCNLSIFNCFQSWWGEGDDMFFVDGQSFPPDLHGTGTEDYLCHAWGMQPNQAPYHGVSVWKPRRPTPEQPDDDWIGYFTVYRFHLVDPVPFTKSLVMSIEHGHANDRSDDWSSVAYWYLDRPTHKRYCTMPAPLERIANMT